MKIVVNPVHARLLTQNETTLQSVLGVIKSGVSHRNVQCVDDPMELKFSLTEPQITLVRAHLSSIGIPLTGNTGTFTARGITAEYEYDPESEYLTVRVVKKPMFVTEGLVRAKMEEWLGVRAE